MVLLRASRAVRGRPSTSGHQATGRVWGSHPDDPAGSARQAQVRGISVQTLLSTFGLVEILLYLGFGEVPSGCRCKPCRDLLSGRLLVGLQVIHGYPDAFVAYVVRVLGDERV